MKYFAHLCFGYNQMEGFEIIEAETEDEAYKLAYAGTIDWAAQYGFYQDFDTFDTYDEVGSCWDEDLQEYEQEGTIAPSVTLYIAEKHDDYL